MTRFASVVLVSSLWLGGGLSAQQPAQSSLHASLEREAIRVASTAANDEPSESVSTGLNSGVQTERPDDWDAVRQLKNGTGVLVTTRQNPRINGKVSAVSEDTLQMTVRGRQRTLLRNDIREVRLGYRLSVGQHVALGLLLGGVTGRTRVGPPCIDCPVDVGLTYGILWGGIGGYMFGEAVHARPGRLVYTLAKP